MRGLLRRRWVQAVLAVAAVVAVAALVLFEPWRAFTRSAVDEALPAAAPAAPSSSASVGTSAPPAAPRELAGGAFVSQEHETRGRARVLELGDGSRVLRLEDFATSDGPDVHVWLTDQAAGGGWGTYDDGRAVKLGKIKATDGNQNYAIPPDASLPGLRSVVIWCDRFNVAFGSAALTL
ncbi:DM13 domain-containing protein [Amycolatopsis anabasis]|uniref:DM13 domain-containing protein n=1 Tax=Amycolatopsis anabasis TaxID=1840409 RepID=UPI0015D22625|nr:DM13 domain-containing protein [Amycolatopsis anabasis]